MNRDERGPWYLLTGLVIGAVLGLVYAWVIQPVEYVNTAPASLRTDFKDQYRALIAAAYLGNSDLVRARARLELLQDPDIFRALSEQAQRTLANSGSSSEARALGILAIALGQAPPGPAIAITQERAPTALPFTSPIAPTGEVDTTQANVADATSTEALAPDIPATDAVVIFPSETITPQPSASPTEMDALPILEPTLALSTTPEASLPPSETAIPRPTFTPTPTRTPSLTPGAPFVLLSREKLCSQALGVPLVQVEALNRFNQPVAGVVVIVNWAGSEERFYTGLKPEKGLGYADYTLSPGVIYALRLGENGEPVNDLSAAQCLGVDGKYFWGIWLLKFVQP